MCLLWDINLARGRSHSSCGSYRRGPMQQRDRESSVLVPQLSFTHVDLWSKQTRKWSGWTRSTLGKRVTLKGVRGSSPFTSANHRFALSDLQAAVTQNTIWLYMGMKAGN